MTSLEDAGDDMLGHIIWDESGVVAAGKDVDGVAIERSELLAELGKGRKAGWRISRLHVALA
jgi:hypothetical protein